MTPTRFVARDRRMRSASSLASCWSRARASPRLSASSGSEVIAQVEPAEAEAPAAPRGSATSSPVPSSALPPRTAARCPAARGPALSGSDAVANVVGGHRVAPAPDVDGEQEEPAASARQTTHGDSARIPSASSSRRLPCAPRGSASRPANCSWSASNGKSRPPSTSKPVGTRAERALEGPLARRSLRASDANALLPSSPWKSARAVARGRQSARPACRRCRCAGCRGPTRDVPGRRRARSRDR